MKKLLLPILCALMLCGCADTPPEETTASTETTTPAETTATETTTAETTAQTTTESPIATETTYIESLGETKVKLSTLGEEDLRKFFTDAGMKIPEMWRIVRVSKIFAALEENPDLYPTYYDQPLSRFNIPFRYAALDYLALVEQDPMKYPTFSEMTESQCLAVLKERGVEIPYEYLYGFDVKKELCVYESNKDYFLFSFGMDFNAYFEDVRYAFKSYYGIPDDSRSPTLMGKPRLSLMSDEECKQFLIDAGVSIPTKAAENNPFKYLFWMHEQDPNYTVAVSWTIMADFYDAMRIAISEYYGMPLPIWWYPSE